MEYNHWAPLGLLGEILPWADNCVELADGKGGRPKARDRYGLPVAKVTFGLKENDKKLIEFGKNKTMEIMWAAGAKEVVQESRFAHLVGAARMSAKAEDGVCDKFGRTWDVENLFVMDGSVMPTQGSANPGLTIQALAARTGGLFDLAGQRCAGGWWEENDGRAGDSEVTIAAGDVLEGRSAYQVSSHSIPVTDLSLADHHCRLLCWK